MTKMRIHVLYVEDDDVLRAAIARALRGDGMDVSAVASVAEVAAALSVFKFDVVVSDWDLGRGGTGGQVYDLVRERQPTLVTRFMFLCGDRPVTTAHLPWLQKPARNRDVVAAVTELVFSSARGGRQTGVRGSLV